MWMLITIMQMCIYYVLDMIESANTRVYSYKYTKEDMVYSNIYV